MREVDGLRFTPQMRISMGGWMQFPVFQIISSKHLYRSWNTENAQFVYLFWVIECLTNVPPVVSRS